MIDDPHGPERAERLRRFILLDVAISSGAVVFTLSIWLWVERNGWLLLVVGLVALGAALMALGLRPLARGRTQGAIAWLVAGNWLLALTTSAVAVFAWPIQVIAAVLPVVIAVPYVSRAAFRLLIGGAVVIATVAASLGRLQDFSGLTASVPEWVTDTVLIGFMPFMAVLITQAGSRSAASLRESLEASLRANQELRRNEELLAEQARLLERSRSRIVAAADRERRRIERDLHDGAQQRLVGLSLQVSLARELVARDPARARDVLDRIRDEVRHAQEEMRALVQGLYPPVLTEHGLGPAIRSVLGRLDNPLRTEIDDLPRYDGEVEAAVYFLCVEAVQNILKHAGPTATVHVTLRAGAEIVLEVVDDGPGFDVAAAPEGMGLANMGDRVGAAGGSVVVDSRPGVGTRVRARVPIG